ncbi:hypothetical protein JTE90_025287 [Oedothorax gibbosus]|uniref:Uncharacterized protein n=1 Tax=Oedothorax gibbosus TaxID=931172 RepID=A0AAV6TI60_9ARAC|nr:hypothetical protein JTE90_025287 [Oedothorax gibbosus]
MPGQDEAQRKLWWSVRSRFLDGNRSSDLGLAACKTNRKPSSSWSLRSFLRIAGAHWNSRSHCKANELEALEAETISTYSQTLNG